MNASIEMNVTAATAATAATVGVINMLNPFERRLYEIGVPVITFFCSLTFVINSVIVVSSAWMRRPLSPTMHLNISLAAADAVASLVVGLGLILNSLLPVVYGIPIPTMWPCKLLVLEAFRLGAVIVTVVHLLALAINHYIGIVRPLHYVSCMTERTVSVLIAIMWVAPNIALVATFSMFHQQGFQSDNCSAQFLTEIAFRLHFSIFFFGPLLIMVFIYGHILVIVRRHLASRRALMQMAAVSGSSRVTSSTRLTSSRAARTSSRPVQSSFNCHSTAYSGGGSLRYDNRPYAARHRNAKDDPSAEQARSVRSNIKAVMTTLLIVGTCVLGWMPVVVWYVVYCRNCMLTPADISRQSIIITSITVNVLIVVKSCLDPIIYTMRMKDFQMAFRRMRCYPGSGCLPPVAGGQSQMVRLQFHRQRSNSIASQPSNAALELNRHFRKSQTGNNGAYQDTCFGPGSDMDPATPVIN